MRKSTKLGLDSGDLYRIDLIQRSRATLKAIGGTIAAQLASAAAERQAMRKPHDFWPTVKADEIRRYQHAHFIRKAREYRGVAA